MPTFRNLSILRDAPGNRQSRPNVGGQQVARSPGIDSIKLFTLEIAVGSFESKMMAVVQNQNTSLGSSLDAQPNKPFVILPLTTIEHSTFGNHRVQIHQHPALHHHDTLEVYSSRCALRQKITCLPCTHGCFRLLDKRDESLVLFLELLLYKDISLSDQ